MTRGRYGNVKLGKILNTRAALWCTFMCKSINDIRWGNLCLVPLPQFTFVLFVLWIYSKKTSLHWSCLECSVLVPLTDWLLSCSHLARVMPHLPRCYPPWPVRYPSHPHPTLVSKHRSLLQQPSSLELRRVTTRTSMERKLSYNH